ncbi:MULTISPECIES: DUF397 domain-containing protein [Actinomycetes]|uniref:DUF397 domain-containing protein n=1 Tax=Actinomycetes TaxID=1760 RepID=UPI000DC6552B|nr:MULTISPECIES: DUF397 domain-containing protein [Streptomyces]ATY96323.1 DUF397 domain-containing protein [Streptomyces cavourensis]MBH0244425.1 DUF397 domain-containing protein [Streptomyces cavourensis]NUV79489.1 DUF397 domain-containing protein [Streptomyces sp. CAI-155]
MTEQSASQAMQTELEVAPWRKSTYSGSNNNCIEHAPLPSGRHAVRDTKDRSLGAHVFAPTAWQAFVTAVQDGSL